MTKFLISASVFSMLAVAGAAGAGASPVHSATDFERAWTGQNVQLADYDWHHHHYHHRDWDRRHRRWHYYD